MGTMGGPPGGGGQLAFAFRRWSTVETATRATAVRKIAEPMTLTWTGTPFFWAP